MLPRCQPTTLEPNTSAQDAWCPDSDPSTRTRFPRYAFREEDRAHGEGCREDATSRRTIFPPGADAGVAGESRAYRIVLVLVANSHKKSAETSLGAADTSVCATFISSEGSKNVETPAAGFQPALPLTYKAHPAGWKAGCSQD